MTLPRDRVPDLSLEPLADRNGRRRAPVGDVAQVRLLETPASSVGGFSVAYQALIDAVFTAPGAAEWLAGLGRRVAALVASQNATRQPAAPPDAIRAADPNSGR